MVKKREDWMQTLWRPMMGWLYMLICLLDMAVFPVLWALWQGINHVPITQWNPLTLQGAGLFHIAMGAVLGIAAFGRTQEKLAGTAANPTTTNMNGVSMGSPMMGSPMGSQQSGQFGYNPGGFTSGVQQPNRFAQQPAVAPAVSPRPSYPALDPSDPPARNTRND